MEARQGRGTACLGECVLLHVIRVKGLRSVCGLGKQLGVIFVPDVKFYVLGEVRGDLYDTRWHVGGGPWAPASVMLQVSLIV